MPWGGKRPGAGRPRTGSAYEAAVKAGFKGSRAAWYRQHRAKPPERLVKLEKEIAALKAALAQERLEHAETRSRYQRASGAHRGIMTRAEYKKIRAGLHPDRVQDDAERKRYTQAFQIFGQLEWLVRKS